MTIDTFSQLGSASFTSSGQAPQVASFDPWQAEHAFTLYEQPYPGISRAMLGPQGIGYMAPAADQQRRCLAVAAGGVLIASTWVSQAPGHAPQNLWQQVLYDMAVARQRQHPHTDLRWHATPQDCLKNWSSPAFWDPLLRRCDLLQREASMMPGLADKREADPHADACGGAARLRVETQTQTKYSEQIAAGVRFVFNALEPELCAVLTQRPRLSAMTAVRLLSLAARHSPVARSHALEALATESMGVLHLMVSGQPPNDAHQVRESVFSGKGVPDAFAELGVAKAGGQTASASQNSLLPS